MVWRTTFPDGSKSVKANESIGQDNTTYIKTTMQLDHFWDESASDGYHRKVSYPASNTDLTVGVGMAGSHYIRRISADAPTQEVFYRKSTGEIYQVTPTVLTGTKATNDSYSNLVAVPKNVYGDIFMYKNAAGTIGLVQAGTFYSDASYVYAYATRSRIDGTNNTTTFLYFANYVDTVNLNIRVRRGEFGSSSDGTWNYIVTYRGL